MSTPAILELCTAVSLALCALMWKKIIWLLCKKKEIGVRKARVASPRILNFRGSEPESVLLYSPKGTPVEKQRNFCLNVVEGRGGDEAVFQYVLLMALLLLQTCDLQTQQPNEDKTWIIYDRFVLYSLRDFLVVLCALIASTSPTHKFRRAS